MLTFFTTAKPFHGHSAVIQRNALESWRFLDGYIEIMEQTPGELIAGAGPVAYPECI